MGASYTIANYMGPFLVYTLGSMLVMGILCVFLGRKLALKFQRFWVAYVPLIVYVFFLYLLGLHAVPVLKQTGDLLVPGEYELRTTAGQVQSVTPAQHAPPCYVDGKIRGLNSMSIGEESYLVIADGKMAEGMFVQIQYADFESNVILSWAEISKEQVSHVLNEQVDPPPAEAPSKEIPEQTKQLATVLYRLGFVGFLGLVALNFLPNRKIAGYLFEKDGQVHGQILPNRPAILLAALPLLFLSLIVTGIAIGGENHSILLVLIVGGGAMLAILVSELFSHLKIDGQTLHLRRIGKTKQYETSDICSVRFQSCRGFTGQQLVIVFNDGKSYWFHMDHFVGVQNTYNTLTGIMDKRNRQEESETL